MVVSSTPLVLDYIISACCVHLGSLCLSVSPIGLWAPSEKGLSELVMNPSVRETQGEILLHHPRAQATWWHSVLAQLTLMPKKRVTSPVSLRPTGSVPRTKSAVGTEVWEQKQHSLPPLVPSGGWHVLSTC